MRSIASLPFAAFAFILRWAFAAMAALLVPPLALLMRPWMRRRKLTREDAIAAVVGMVEHGSGRLWRTVAALLGPLLGRLLYRSCERFNALRESPLGERLLTRLGFDEIYVSHGLDLLGGGFNWTIRRTNGPAFEGRIGGDRGSWCEWKTAEERAAELSGLAFLLERFGIE